MEPRWGSEVFCSIPPGGGYAATGGYKQGTPMGFGRGTARPQGKEGQSETSLGRAAVPGRRGARGRAPSLRWRLLTASREGRAHGASV